MINIGIIGFGYWGPKLARNFTNIPGTRVACVCDARGSVLAGVSKLHPEARITTSADDLINDPAVDAVVIATPVSGHYSLAKQVLEAGKDVFVEKPFTQNSAQAAELLDLAERKGRVLHVDHTFLFTGAIRKMKELMSGDSLGELHYIDSVRINLGLYQPDVSVLYDLAPHDLSIVTYLTDLEPVMVSAMGMSQNDYSHESVVYLHLEYPHGLVAHFHLSWLAPVKIRRTLLAGSRKMVVYDDLNQSERIKIYDKGVDISPNGDDPLRPTFVDYRSGDIWAPKIDQREALNYEAEVFAGCVRERKQSISDGRFGLRIMRILDAAQKSLKSHRPVELS